MENTIYIKNNDEAFFFWEISNRQLFFIRVFCIYLFSSAFLCRHHTRAREHYRYNSSLDRFTIGSGNKWLSEGISYHVLENVSFRSAFIINNFPSRFFIWLVVWFIAGPLEVSNSTPLCLCPSLFLVGRRWLGGGGGDIIFYYIRIKYSRTFVCTEIFRTLLYRLFQLMARYGTFFFSAKLAHRVPGTGGV